MINFGKFEVHIFTQNLQVGATFFILQFLLILNSDNAIMLLKLPAKYSANALTVLIVLIKYFIIRVIHLVEKIKYVLLFKFYINSA